MSYIHAVQDPSGAWLGRWGICFTYATMFALESLSLVGETYENSETVRKACDFIVSKQREDGGWGESWEVRTVNRLSLNLTDIDLFRHVKNSYGWSMKTRRSYRPHGRDLR